MRAPTVRAVPTFKAIPKNSKIGGMKILPPEARFCRRGSPAWFTGTVWLDEIVTTLRPARLRAVLVSFEPAARTAWHTHPLGQTLHVLSGIGRIQLYGQPVQDLRPGDTVWIEPNELHWHGAGPGYTFVHLAMQEADDQNIDVAWHKHVTDEEYGAV
jgi:quercetin dioxygenase-like cupin family protein